MTLKPNSWRVLEHAVEIGINYGWSRAHKHDEHPSEEAIKAQLQEQIVNAIGEWFDFDRGDDE